MRIPRREFIKRGVIGGGALIAAPTLIPRHCITLGGEAQPPPSKRINVGLIGIGAMGSGHLHRLAGDPGFLLSAICDVDSVRRDNAKASVESIYAAAAPSGSYRGCTAYRDYREILARDDIDAVLVATPDHWHSLIAIDAAKAGKDIYLEKPISVTIDEGRRVVETVQRYNRVFQTGTQYRSTPAVRQICEFVRRGGLGKVHSAFALISSLGGWLGSERAKPYAQTLDVPHCGEIYAPTDFALPAEPVPDGLDWDMWVGPAPWRPYNKLYHSNPSPGVVPWAFAIEFGVTSSTWHLSHSADVIQYAIGAERTGPVEIIHPSTGEFPTITCRYASGTKLHLVDHWGMVKDAYKALPAAARLAGNFGGLFIGERGWITTMSTGGPVECEPASLIEEIGLKSREVNIGANNHHANWLECLHTRAEPSCGAELGHRAASVGNLTNIAFWTGQSLRWDPVTETFIANDVANRMRSRAARPPWRLS